MIMSGGRNRSPIFTASQWQELEQQALIFKYMASEVPIPPDLISTVRRSLEYSSTFSRFIPRQPIGAGNFEMGLGRKAYPEPGRCRRTDGKKWRCSKEAHPDSKYCERHMHRGKNRSRKPVEVISSTSSSTTTAAAITSLSSAETYPFLYAHSSSSIPPGSFSAPQNNPTHNLFMDSGSYSQTDEDSFTPLTMSSSPSGNSQSHYFQSLTGESREQHQQQKEKSSFLLGTDFKSERPIKGEREEENQMPFHHFFGEKPFHGFSTTQFSISMPPSTQELFGSKSTFHTDG
ncbi:growth-regulating factor 5-like [Actinidia eriantha]|uniref:growth-regulating factor 5-like n=1 Tax=Actinidia eriantha TaxID=165200 RepID=UPI0025861D85|nr:growth-regulating factor 5-like [Actinidia eriantha]